MLLLRAARLHLISIMILLYSVQGKSRNTLSATLYLPGETSMENVEEAQGEADPGGLG